MLAKSKPEEKVFDPPVHPANNLPKMSKRELEELAKDIEKHGLEEPIIYWRDNREEANGAKGPFPLYLLDGVNRRDALRLLGIDDPRNAKKGHLVERSVRFVDAIKQVGTLGSNKTTWETDVDPYAFHLSMNAYRRHLTSDQKRWAIKQAIIADPIASDRKIARKIGANDKTVAKTRSEMDVRNAEIPQNERKPLDRAKAVLKTEPNLTTRQLQAKAKVSAMIAQQARNDLSLPKQTQSKAAPPQQKPTKEQCTRATAKEADRAAEQFAEWVAEVANGSDLVTIITWLREIDRKHLLKHAIKLLSKEKPK
jgi:ParB-like chromosome segregation protein Spo0J